MKKIVLAGLVYDSNLGDQAIFESTMYELKKVFDDNKVEVEFNSIDLYGREKEHIEKNKIIIGFIDKIKLKLKGNIKISCEKVNSKCKKIISKDVDAIIFVGGGLIKYKQQKEICNTIQIVIDYAEKYNIPVMFSGVGIEGYDSNDVDCQNLKKSINKDCVKYITTRDDIELLNKSYIENNDIHTAKVADSACIINKIYPNTLKGQSNIIGLGMIRHNLFVDYGINFSDQQAINLYKELYFKIIAEGYKCKIFTNGNIADQIFAEELIQKLNINKDEVLVKRPQNMKELINIITDFDAVIVARLHASIISYSYDIPSVGLVWNNKQRFFGKNIGYENRFVEFPNLNANVIFNELKIAMKTGYKAIDNEKYKNSNYNCLKKFIEEYVFERNN